MRPKFENFGFLQDYQISIYKLQKNLKLQYSNPKQILDYNESYRFDCL
jgi:hypothetical protein